MKNIFMYIYKHIIIIIIIIIIIKSQSPRNGRDYCLDFFFSLKNTIV